MASCIAFHSYKGGTGKTTIAANLAALLAKKGYRVFLLDLDVYAPSLQAYFDTEPNKFINDFLNGTAEIRDVVVDLTPTLEQVYSSNNAAGRTSSSNSNSDINATTTASSNQKDIGKGKEKEKGKGKIAGKLWVGFCSSKKEEIYRLEGGGPGKQDSSKIQLLRRFILLREQLISLHDADYIIIDTSPGIRYWSINALAVADTLFLTLKMGDLDITGTRKMAEEIYGSFTKFGARSYLVMNRVAGYCVPQPLTISSLSPTGEHKNISQPNSSSFFTSHSPHVSDTISRSATGGRGGGGGEDSGTLASSGTHEGSITSTSSSSIMQQQKDESNVIASMLSSEVSMDVISAIACYCDVQFSNKEFLTALKYPDHPFAQQFEKLVQTIEAMQVNKAK